MIRFRVGIIEKKTRNIRGGYDGDVVSKLNDNSRLLGRNKKTA